MLIGAQAAPPVPAAASLPVATTGILPTDTKEMVRLHLVPILGSLVVHSRVRLTRLSEPELTRPLVAQLDVQLGRHRVRAQVAAATMADLVGMLTTRAIEQLRRFPKVLAPCLRERVTSSSPSSPELLPPCARRLVRHKSCRPIALSVGEAIAVPEAMDYRFHLFREKYSRQDSVVIRTSPDRYRIVQPAPNPIGIDVASPPLGLAATPRLSIAEATARLNLTGALFEVFTDTATGRACVLYARYDGHYGTLAPAVSLSRSA
jgi:sigma 54 modulation/S30EA-like ribosomal protein